MTHWIFLSFLTITLTLIHQGDTEIVDTTVNPIYNPGARVLTAYRQARKLEQQYSASWKLIIECLVCAVDNYKKYMKKKGVCPHPPNCRILEYHHQYSWTSISTFLQLYYKFILIQNVFTGALNTSIYTVCNLTHMKYNCFQMNVCNRPINPCNITLTGKHCNSSKLIKWDSNVT
jgi:hypothetical protein